MVLVDMVHRINPSVPMFYLDTDFLFRETYATRDRVIERYELKSAQVIQVKSLLTPQKQAESYGDALWAAGLFEDAEARYKEALAIAPGQLEAADLHDDPSFVINSIASYVRTKSYEIGGMEERERAIRSAAEAKVKSRPT